MKNLLTQWELKKKTKRFAQLFSYKRYTKEELRDPYIGKKFPNPVRN